MLLDALSMDCRRVGLVGTADAQRLLPGRSVVRDQDVDASPPGSLDALVYHALERLPDPLGLLTRHRPKLRTGGVALASFANAGHHGHLLGLLAGEAHIEPELTRNAVVRLLLDAGYFPASWQAEVSPMAEPAWRTLQPLLAGMRLDPARARLDLEATGLLVRASPWPDAAGPDGTTPVEPMTFAVCVNDEGQLRADLLSSPCLGPGTPHEVLAFRDCRSAAEGLNAGLRRARHRRVVCLHQDVYLPRDWDRRFLARLAEAEARFGPVGVAGVYGVRREAAKVVRAGRVLDRERALLEPEPMPARVDCLDELLLAADKDAGLAFDPALGWHFYGADLCLQAQARGLACVALDAPCWHHSRSVGLPADFGPSAAAFARKWRARLPIATSCVVIEADGAMRLS